MTVAINGRFLVDSFGGVKRFATELTERLARVRDDVVLVLPRAAADVALPGVNVEVVGRSSGPVWEQVELPLWLARHGRPLLLNLAGIAPIAYAKQISVLHDIAPALRPRDFTRPFLLQWQLSVRWGMLRGRRELVTVSAASQREIAEYFGVDVGRVRVIHLGADSFAAPDTATPAVEVRARFVAFGRHGAGKNVRVILEALAQIPADAGIEVEMIGRLDPGLEPYAVERGIAADRIIWRGPVTDDELAVTFQHATGMIWPSKHEGFGLPPLEAQSLGVPVVASDIPVNREILEDSAVYFSATDARELAARMTQLASNATLRADLAGRAVDNARRFTWENTTSAWDRLVSEKQH